MPKANRTATSSATPPTPSVSAVGRRSGRSKAPSADASDTSNIPSLAPSTLAKDKTMAGGASATAKATATKKTGDLQNHFPWRHPDELAYICREDWNKNLVIEYLRQKVFSIPPRDSSSIQLFKITRAEGVVSLPRGYRVPLLFVARFLWDSLKLVMTAADPDKEWKEYRFDIIHLSRLCHHLFDKAEADNKKSLDTGGKGLAKTWRCKMFDRVLTRFWQRWLISREWSIRGFWHEFGEEEYEEDVLARDWARWAYKGHNGFALTKEEVVNGVSQQQYLAGLTKCSDGSWKWDPNPSAQTAAQADMVLGPSSISNSYSNNATTPIASSPSNLSIVKPSGPTVAQGAGDKPMIPVIAEPIQIGSTVNLIKKELISPSKVVEASATPVVVTEPAQAEPLPSIRATSASATAGSSAQAETSQAQVSLQSHDPPVVGEKRPREDDEEESPAKRVCQSPSVEQPDWASMWRKRIGLPQPNLEESSPGQRTLSRDAENIVDATLRASQSSISTRVQVFPSLQQALAASNSTTPQTITRTPIIPQVLEPPTPQIQKTPTATTSATTPTPPNLIPPIASSSTQDPHVTPEAASPRPMSLGTSPFTSTRSPSVDDADVGDSDTEPYNYKRELEREYEEISRASQVDTEPEPSVQLAPSAAQRSNPIVIPAPPIPPPKPAQIPTTSQTLPAPPANSSTSVASSLTKATSTTSGKDILDSLLSDPRPIKRLHAIFLLRDLSWYLGTTSLEGQQLELADRVRHAQTWSIPAVRLPTDDNLDLAEARAVIEKVCFFLEVHLEEKLYGPGELEARLDRELEALHVVPMFSKQEVGIQVEPLKRSMAEKEVDASPPARVFVDVESMTSASSSTTAASVQTDTPEEEDETMDLDQSRSGSQSQTPPLSSDATMVDLNASAPSRMEKTMTLVDLSSSDMLKTELRSTMGDTGPSPTMVMKSVMRNVVDILESQRGGSPSGSSKVVPYDSPLVRVLLDEVKSMKDELRSNQSRNQEEIEALTELYRSEIDSLRSDLKSREDRYRREVEVTRQRHHQELDDVRETIREIERDREKVEEEARFSASELLEMRRRVSLLEGRSRVRSPSVSGSYSQAWADALPGMDVSVARRPSYHPLGHLLSQEEVLHSQQPLGPSIPSTPVAQELDRSAGRDDEDAPPLPIKSQRKFHAIHRLSTSTS